MKIRTVHIALVVAVLIAAAALLNPSADQHRAEIKEKIAERSNLAALLMLGDIAAFLSNYHSLGIASYTMADNKVLSVGAFGVVVVLEHSEDN